MEGVRKASDRWRMEGVRKASDRDGESCFD
jgi:hypothetical protein